MRDLIDRKDEVAPDHDGFAASRKGRRSDRLQHRVWGFMKRRGPTTSEDVALRFGITRCSARHILRRLKARGCAAPHGTNRRRTFTAIGKCPTDLRGLHAQAAINLAQGRVLGSIELAKRRGRLYIPRPRHALDAAMRAPMKGMHSG